MEVEFAWTKEDVIAFHEFYSARAQPPQGWREHFLSFSLVVIVGLIVFTVATSRNGLTAGNITGLIVAGGVLPDGTPYAANDPSLLAWVHVTETASFCVGEPTQKVLVISKT